MNNIVYFDLEVSKNGKILDIGAVNQDGDTFHSSVLGAFMEFISSADYLCGHNIISHDICYLKPYLRKSYKLIDTLYLSPILFPERPYHNLVKDDKILSNQLNNPLSDSLKAKQLFEDEMERFKSLPENFKKAYFSLLHDNSHFNGFFDYAQYNINRFAYLFNSVLVSLSLSMMASTPPLSSTLESYASRELLKIELITTSTKVSFIFVCRV